VLSGGVVTATGVTIQATGTGGDIGVLAQTSGLANLTDATILTTGNSDTGVKLDTSGQISMCAEALRPRDPMGKRSL
jgi:hypothetical protein